MLSPVVLVLRVRREQTRSGGHKRGLERFSFVRPYLSLYSLCRVSDPVTTRLAFAARARLQGVQLLHVQLHQRRRIPIAHQQRSARMSSRISWSGAPVLPVDPRVRSRSSFCSQRSRCTSVGTVPYTAPRYPARLALVTSRVSSQGEECGEIITRFNLSTSETASKPISRMS